MTEHWDTVADLLECSCPARANIHGAGGASEGPPANLTVAAMCLSSGLTPSSSTDNAPFCKECVVVPYMVVGKGKSCTAHLHFLKAESQGTASQSPGHEAAREEDGRAARGAVIVAVGDGDPCQPHLIESTLTAGGAAKDIPHILCRRRRGRSKD